VSVLRIASLVVLAALLLACSREPSASDLTVRGITNLQSAKTVHIDGSGAIAIKGQGGFSLAFEFKIAGDAELPDKSRMNVQIALMGMNLAVETITLAGREFTKDAATGKWSESTGTSSVNSLMDPMGNIDASLIRDVVEVDRPEVDGRRTRHLRYQADTTKMLDELRRSAGSSSQSIANPHATGELWIRIDDSQIVRQLVKVSMEVEGLAGFLPASASNVGTASVELSLDTRFSRHGEAVPEITAPPLSR